MEQKKRKKRPESEPNSRNLDEKPRKQRKHRQSEPAVSTQGLKLEKSKRRKSEPDTKKVKTISLNWRDF